MALACAPQRRFGRRRSDADIRRLPRSSPIRHCTPFTKVRGEVCLSRALLNSSQATPNRYSITHCQLCRPRLYVPRSGSRSPSASSTTSTHCHFAK